MNISIRFYSKVACKITLFSQHKKVLAKFVVEIFQEIHPQGLPVEILAFTSLFIL
jgi:hypothetical protein